MLALFAFGAASCGHKAARASVPAAPARIGSSETGIASWYGIPYHGRRTSSGEVYDMNRMTAAHRALPFQTWVEVTNLSNGKTVDVRITDRGPFVHGRVIDLSQAAARDIDMLRTGTAKVRLVVIPPPRDLPPNDVLARDARPAPHETGGRSSSIPAKPGPTAASAPPDWFVVQAGAFEDRDRAEMLRAQMVEAFAEARVVAGGNERLLWKVIVGRQMTAEQANELAARVRQATGMALIVAEPDPVAPDPPSLDHPLTDNPE